ncbi:MAG: hypothetical protein K6E19_03500 [Lachnospiraceae bacterium]|nr:hypothetical protein [Lachnospiraceae bacterium]
MDNGLGGERKVNPGEIAVGIDLTDTYSQVSYGIADAKDVDTLSVINGGNEYMIPTALFRRREVNQWYFGADAVRNADGDGYYVDRLITRAEEGQEIVLGNEHYRPSALIALFIRRLLSMLNMLAPTNRIATLMITVDNLDDNLAAVLSEAVASLSLNTDQVSFQSHMESFYFYNIYQPAELWGHSVLLFDFSDEYLKSLKMSCNKNTTPVVAFVDPGFYQNVKVSKVKNLLPDSMDAREADAAFLEIARAQSSNQVLSAIYFIGDGFNREIYKNSLAFLCTRGRAFEGNNLYSKGACYAAKNKIYQTIISENHVLLGNDKLKANVGINVLKQGQNSYLPLLDAGVNWFEVRKSCKIILNEGNKVNLVITPMTGRNPEIAEITLSDLPKRPPKTTRLHISVRMQSESRMEVKIKDLGFGEMFPSSKLEWTEVIVI